jgi:Protein of unknown function (DUF2637)
VSRARLWATAAFLLGVAVSVAANVAHTWYIPGASGRPPVGAQLAAAFYPLALLLTVEILARVPWPVGPWWAAARYGGTALVAGVAAVVSYRHMAALLAAYGEDALTAAIGPLAVDGLMVVASFALLAIGREAPVQRGPVTESGGPLARWPLPDLDPAPPAHRAVDGYAMWDQIEPDPGVPKAVPAVPDPVLARAAEAFAGDLAQGRTPGIRPIKKRLGVGQDRAREVQQHLAVLADR